MTETSLAVIESTGTAIQVPQTNELDAMMQMAARLSKTNFVPNHYRGKPDEILACWMTARELGIGVMSAMREIAIIQGTPTMSAGLMTALVRQAGHSIEGKTSATSATVRGTRRDNGDTAEFVYTVEMAKRARLLEKDNWRNYPESMCWARAVSQVCRMLFKDVLVGITYTPEEMGAEVDSQGALRDVTPAALDAPSVSDVQKARLKALNETLPPRAKLQPAARKALIDKGYEAAEAELVTLHVRECGVDCAHVSGEIIRDDEAPPVPDELPLDGDE